MSDTPNIDKGLSKILTRIAERTEGHSPAVPLDSVGASVPDVVPPLAREPARVHPEKRGQVILSNLLAELSGEGAKDGPEVSYYSPELIQATLPHSDPKTHVWVRKNGNFSLVVSSGYDENGEVIGIPYGSFPRLVLAHIITQVVATHERRIELSSHFGRFLADVGYVGNHRGKNEPGRRIRHQLLRLLNANIAFRYQEGTEQAGRKVAHQMHVAPKFDLWWNFKGPEQGTLFESWIELSEDFYHAILSSPVPLRTDVLKKLKKSPLAIDVYMWASYRLFGMQIRNQDQLHVTFGQLQGQFGTGISEENYRKFRQELKLAFAKVAAEWQAPNGQGSSLLNFEFTDDGLTLYSSPLLVSRGNRKSNVELAQKILESRAFDEDTRRKARLLAGTWNVKALEAEYWAWLAKRNFTPANPTAHFFAFIKRHRKRNGETV